MKGPYIVEDRVIVYGSNFGVFTSFLVEAKVVQITDSWGVLVQETKKRFPYFRRKRAWVSWAMIDGKVLEYAKDGTALRGVQR